MNLLICGFNADWHNRIVSGLISKLDPDLCVVISEFNHVLDENVCDIVRYDFDDLLNLNFNTFDINDYKSLDYRIIDDMSKCERLFFLMEDRQEVRTHRSVDYKKRKNSYYDILRIVNGILDRHQIDTVIIDYIPHIGFDYVLYELCKKKGIRVVTQAYALSLPYKTTSRYFLNDIWDSLPDLNKEYSDEDVVLSERMNQYLYYYSKKNVDVESFVSLDALVAGSHVLFRKLKTALKLIFKLFLRFDTSLFYNLSKNYHLHKLKSTERKYAYVKDVPSKYLYFPLHYQPECTSLPMGRIYGDQDLIVQMISELLPDGFKLCIKPHPNTSILADEDFYKRISRYKNVVLMSSDVDTYELIDKASGIVTITGTVAWEALTREKPVMVFGCFFYQYAPMVYHITTREECKQAIKEIIYNPPMFNLNRLKNFLNNLDNHLIEGYLDLDYECICDLSMEDNIENTINGYIEYLDDSNNWTA